MSLLPGPKPSINSSQHGAIAIYHVQDLVNEEADKLFRALGAKQARTILQEAYDDADTASGLAGRLSTSVQSVSYHLEKLETAGLIRVAGTQYSSRGREMDVYAPGNNPIVFCIGAHSRQRGLYSILKHFSSSFVIVTAIWIITHTLLSR
ncbi:hypothetical protein C455_09202 [Haloferax larsenii JCM 13917]|nr:hypothetical protein C455_09202 [Haloferax larsenii JCM 13917]